MSFFGGGTDYPNWYREHGGAVLSTTINRYCYLNSRYLPPFFEIKYRTVYSRIELTKTIEEIEHPSVKGCLSFLGLDRGVEIIHNADLPAKTGIGSSSAFTVGLLHTLYALQGRMVTKRQLALDAIHVEQNIIREHVGSQDQTMAAFGGFNLVEFGGSQEITVSPITLPANRLHELESSLMLFYTGISRFASDIAGEQIRQIGKKKADFHLMRQLVDEAMSILDSSVPLDEFGRLLNEGWRLKRSLSCKITTDIVDQIYDTALKAGAVGGKLLGAGGGGFILFFVPPARQQSILKALTPLIHVPVKFETLGSQVIFYSPHDSFTPPTEDCNAQTTE